MKKLKNGLKPVWGVRRWLADYSDPITTPELNRFDLIIYGSPKCTICPAKPKTKHIAYLSWSEVAPDAWYLDAAQAQGVSVLGTNDRWGSTFYDIGNLKWADFICGLALIARDSGFTGVYLDTFDGAFDIANLSGVDEDSDQFRSWLDGGRAVCAKIREAWPDCYLIVNRGFEMFDDTIEPGILKNINSILIEGYTRDRDGGTPSNEDRKWMKSNLNLAKKNYKTILTLDYGKNTNNVKWADKAVKDSMDAGYAPLVVKADLVSPEITGMP